MDDDLDAPLGQLPIQKSLAPRRLSYIGIGISLGGVVFFAGLGALFLRSGSFTPPAQLAQIGATAPSSTTALRASPPDGTATSAAASTPITPQPRPAAAVAGAAVPSPDRKDQETGITVPSPAAALAAEAIERQSGVKITRPEGSTPPGALIIDVAKALNSGPAAAPDPRLIEQTRYGPIPRIGADGARPADVYARPSSPRPGLPRIALLVGGMGLSPRATEAAIASLPGAVTFGFAPYGADLARQTARARQAGHELILEVPMEPFDFSQGNPGPHTLLAEAGMAANNDNLFWFMSRFTGYAGVANFLGGKFTAYEKALKPVLHEIAARGLFYIDDGSSAQSLVPVLAPGQDLAAARADVIIDSAAQPEAIEAALARLEKTARDKGLAIGVASSLPVSIAIIGRFARSLEERGIALVPLSMAMPKLQKSAQQQGLASR